ncbi:MAG: DUF2027 domain-containing protein [Bacteroidales bacterium]|jgi:hypothetical protein|nr:DUF2027 domain-containing protein [Bacteroidales bacterium]
MIQFKVGDRVKFLDQEGGGKISKIVSPVLVNVEMEDGFEIPTLTKELVLDYVDEKAGKIFTSNKNIEDARQSSEKEQTQGQTTNDDDIRIEKIFLSRKGQDVEKGVYLCYVPCDQKYFISGNYYVYLVNNTDTTILYSLFLNNKQGGFVGQDFGSIDEKERCLLATIGNDELESWCNGVIQIMFHKDNSDKVLMPISYEIKVRTAKFFKEGCFVDSGLFAEKVLSVPVAIMSEVPLLLEKQQQVKKEEIIKRLEEKGDVKIVKQTKPISFFDKHLISSKEAEVDLHIEELVDEQTNLSPNDILNIQIDYFKKCLSQAIERHLDKIIFIHGVGQGTLKTKLMAELNNYSFIHYFPASMQKYGIGATEVYIGKNQK